MPQKSSPGCFIKGLYLGSIAAKFTQMPPFHPNTAQVPKPCLVMLVQVFVESLSRGRSRL